MQRLHDHFWPMYVQEIVKIRTSPRNRHNFFAWYLEKSGCFSVKSAYQLATCNLDEDFAGGASCTNPDGSRPVWRCVWNTSVPQKMKVMAWKVVSGALATNRCKSYWHPSTTDTYPPRGLEVEDSFHALVACDHALNLWVRMRKIKRLPDKSVLINTGNDWLLNVLAGCTKDERNRVIMLT